MHLHRNNIQSVYSVSSWSSSAAMAFSLPSQKSIGASGGNSTSFACLGDLIRNTVNQQKGHQSGGLKN
jgi:hypothetical protein